MPERIRPRRGPVWVGFGGAVAGERIVAVANPESAPVQRALRQAQEAGRLIDLTFGRQIRSVVFMDSGHVIRLAVSPETLVARWARTEEGDDVATLGETHATPSDRAI